MQFNSLQFALFFLVIFLLYLALNHKWQNRMLFVASCAFYAAWDWRFLALIFTSITTDYICSLIIYSSNSDRKRRFFLILSILINLSILGFFKYFNFFSANLAVLLSHLGLSIHPILLKLVLPIGISFYTFKTLSYTFDVYTGRMEPTKRYLDYALFVLFFPQLSAGPIMRARDLLPQIFAPRKLSLDKFYEGSYLIYWGLFQKIFIADNLAKIADLAFNTHGPYNGAKVLLAVYAFAFQIYCDFAGYSNIAIGIGKWMGFDTTINFNLPYFSANPRDFWNRWHITLSTWLKDYLYFPIAINKRNWGFWGPIFATIITFTLCGFWHGAAWTYIIWGFYWGLLLVTHEMLKHLLKKIPDPRNAILGKIWFWIKIAGFFQLVCIGWLIFRAESISQAMQMLRSIACNFYISKGIGVFGLTMKVILITLLLVIIEAAQFVKKDSLAILKFPVWLRCALYVLVYLLISLNIAEVGREFIYVQF